MTYKIVYGSYRDELVTLVNHWLARGWQLQGGVSFLQTSNSGIWCQAMIKENEEDGQ